MQKLHIDADPGTGDALGVLLALLDPGLDVVGLTAVGSFISRDQALRNLYTLVEAVDPAKRPRFGGGTEPPREFAFDQRTAVQQRLALHGAKGLGDWLVPDVELHHPKESAKVLVDLSREHPHELVVLTLGPLTNVALACEMDGEFLARLKSLVILGGSWAGMGDSTACAEFNIMFDPAAAHTVLHASAPKTIVPLETTRKVLFPFDFWDRLGALPETPAGLLARSLVTSTLRAHRQQMAIEGMWLRAAVALAAVQQPQSFQRRTAAVEVETEGRLTQGMTVFDRREPTVWRPNVDVLTDVDAQSVLDNVALLIKRVA